MTGVHRLLACGVLVFSSMLASCGQSVNWDGLLGTSSRTDSNEISSEVYFEVTARFATDIPSAYEEGWLCASEGNLTAMAYRAEGSSPELFVLFDGGTPSAIRRGRQSAQGASDLDAFLHTISKKAQRRSPAQERLVREWATLASVRDATNSLDVWSAYGECQDSESEDSKTSGIGQRLEEMGCRRESTGGGRLIPGIAQWLREGWFSTIRAPYDRSGMRGFGFTPDAEGFKGWNQMGKSENKPPVFQRYAYRTGTWEVPSTDSEEEQASTTGIAARHILGELRLAHGESPTFVTVLCHDQGGGCAQQSALRAMLTGMRAHGAEEPQSPERNRQQRAACELTFDEFSERAGFRVSRDSELLNFDAAPGALARPGRVRE